MEQLNRNQRRKNELEIFKFLNKLSPKDKETLEKIVNERFMLTSEKYLADYLTIFMDCTISALKSLGKDNQFIEEYIKIYNEYYNDHMQVVKKNMGECEMAKNKIEAELRERVLKCLEQDFRRNEIVDMLHIELPKVSKNMIHNMIDMVHAELKENELTVSEDDEVNAAIEYIFEEEKPKKNINTVKYKNQKAHEEITATVEKAKEVKKEVEGEIKMSNLKVKEMSLVVEGTNGEYKASKEGVILVRQNAQIDFKSIEELEKWTNEIKEVFKMVGVA